MFWAKRLLLVAIMTGVCAAVPVGAAWAAPPSNDSFSGAKVIGSVPFSDTEDTTEATLDADDASVATACNASGFTFSNSVWYAYSPSSDQTVQLNTSGSSYFAVIGVVTGAPGAFTAVPGGCNGSSAVVSLTAGTTYYFDVLQLGGGSGGTLQLSINEVVAPNLKATVDRSGGFSKSGNATVSGTASCSSGSFASAYAASVTQTVGRIATITGSGPTGDIVCDGTSHPWSITVTPFSGLFRGGKAQATVLFNACNSVTCESQQVTQQVQLKGKG